MTKNTTCANIVVLIGEVKHSNFALSGCCYGIRIGGLIFKIFPEITSANRCLNWRDRDNAQLMIMRECARGVRAEEAQYNCKGSAIIIF